MVEATYHIIVTVFGLEHVGCLIEGVAIDVRLNFGREAER